MSNIKGKFNKDSEFKSEYFSVSKKMIGDGFNISKLGSIEYKKNGSVVMLSEGFEYIINNVDELEVIISPLDILFSKVTFKIYKGSEKKTLPSKFYGIRGTNFYLYFEDETSGSDILPDDIITEEL